MDNTNNSKKVGNKVYLPFTFDEELITPEQYLYWQHLQEELLWQQLEEELEHEQSNN